MQAHEPCSSRCWGCCCSWLTGTSALVQWPSEMCARGQVRLLPPSAQGAIGSSLIGLGEVAGPRGQVDLGLLRDRCRHVEKSKHARAHEKCEMMSDKTDTHTKQMHHPNRDHHNTNSGQAPSRTHPSSARRRPIHKARGFRGRSGSLLLADEL